jgi:hypothetical protein
MLGRRGPPDNDAEVDARAPAESRSSRDELFIGVGSHDGINDEGFQTFIPGTATFGGSRVNLGGGEGHLAGVVNDGSAQHLAITAWHFGLNLCLNDVNRGADELDCLVQGDLAGHGPGRHVEDVGGGVGLGVIVSKPLDEAVNT